MDLINLSASLINEIQELRANVKAGKISMETYSSQLAGIAQIEKLENVMIKTVITEEKFKRPIFSNLKNLPNPEKEAISCPGADNIITRPKCLDYSGENKFNECEGCLTGIHTKRLLLPEK